LPAKPCADAWPGENLSLHARVRHEKTRRAEGHFISTNQKGRLIREHSGFSLKGVTAPHGDEEGHEEDRQEDDEEGGEEDWQEDHEEEVTRLARASLLLFSNPLFPSFLVS
jgi:hypothetical protein